MSLELQVLEAFASQPISLAAATSTQHPLSVTMPLKAFTWNLALYDMIYDIL
jgi:hypothetical protein